MNKLMMVGASLLFLMGGGLAPAERPVELWVPIELYVDGQQVVGMTLPFGILYLGNEDPRENEMPQIALRLHERRHWEAVRVDGIIPYYAHYFFAPGWACQEEQRAGWARLHTACSSW